jgi:hypothetical protein
VTGQPHSHVYLAGSRFDRADVWGAPQAVCKVSVPPEAGVSAPCGGEAALQDVYYPGRRQYAQEPIFVPRRQPKVSVAAGWSSKRVPAAPMLWPGGMGPAHAGLACALPTSHAGGGRWLGAGAGV